MPILNQGMATESIIEGFNKSFMTTKGYRTHRRTSSLADGASTMNITETGGNTSFRFPTSRLNTSSKDNFAEGAQRHSLMALLEKSTTLNEPSYTYHNWKSRDLSLGHRSLMNHEATL